jgi:hypothetical protein
MVRIDEASNIALLKQKSIGNLGVIVSGVEGNQH